MTEYTIEELGDAMPTSLDDIIRKHREHAALRIAAEDDLRPLVADVPYEGRAQDISRWTLVTLDWHPPGVKQVQTILLGYNERERQGWQTSQIVRFDPGTSCFRTHSGTLYRAIGKASGKPDLLRLCAWLHGCSLVRGHSLGQYLAVMHIFY